MIAYNSIDFSVTFIFMNINNNNKFPIIEYNN